jgi:uncharacterized protein (TIGR03067 family)
MQANPTNHLSPDVLGALAAGRLPAAAAADVLAHLHGCAECRQAGTALLGDSFLLRLGAAGPPPSTVVEALPQADTAGTGPSPGQAPAAPPAAPPVLPELRDHPQYQVLRELGRGGMGVVYLAKNTLMDRPEVLKVVNQQLLGQAGAAERFLREVRSAAKLSHPNIVAAYSVLQAGERLVFAMEYVEGEILERVVQAQGRLPVANACHYASQVALGLQHASEKGMVHRDIKPQNLMLVREGKRHVVKVLDFGLAKATREGGEAERGLTGTGWMLGTPDYMAPEQTLDAARADIRADVYSLGCTLYYLLTGSPPFEGKSQFELLQAHHSTEATPLDWLRNDVPAELAAVVAKMMAKDPAGRYQKPVEVAQALAPFIKAGATPAPPAGGKPEAGQKGRPGSGARPSVVRGTVVEGASTIARAVKKMDTAPSRPAPAPAVPALLLEDEDVEDRPSIPRARKRADRGRRRAADAQRLRLWLLFGGIGGGVVLLLVILLVILLSGGGGQLEGRWILIAAEAEGKQQALDGFNVKVLVITTDTMRPEWGKESMKYTVNTSTSPKQINTYEGGRNQEGIYEVNGDELRICMADRGTARPTDFTTRVGEKRVLMIFRRQK